MSRSTFIRSACCLFLVCGIASVPIPVVQAGANGFLSIEADEPAAELKNGGVTLMDASRHFARVAAVTTPAVVHIQAEYSTRTGTTEETGSGVLMKSPHSQEVFVLTNRHVVTRASLRSIHVHLHDGRMVTPRAKLDDRATDVAVLMIDAPDLQPARWGDSDALEIGHVVLAMGSPFGLSQSVTMGIISAKGRRSLELNDRREVINQDFLQTDAAINPGNSGGPLIDLQGRVVGINTAIASSGGGNEGIGFSIPINLARHVVDQLLQHGRVQRGFLGVRLDDNFDDEAARRYRLDRLRGARVVEVYANTPAATAGLRVNDVILQFNSMDIEDENHLIHLVSLTEVNRPVGLLILREGRQVDLRITLIERPEDQRSELPAENRVPQTNPLRPTSLSLERVEPTIAAQLGLQPNQHGLLVMQLDDADPADANSLQLYDVIEAVGRTEVQSEEAFEEALRSLKDGPVLLRVRRIKDSTEQTRLVIWRRPNGK